MRTPHMDIQLRDLTARVHKDIVDSYDEELELELDDRDLDADTLLPQQGRSEEEKDCLLYTSPSPRDRQKSRMPSSA